MTPLEDLLDQAAAALLQGDLTALSRLTPEIEAARIAPVDRMGAERLHRKAQRNARLLDAATRGVKAARLRMAEITRGPTLTTYDARGQKAEIAPLALSPARRV
ncbi:MAG: flagellar biosynthesis protein FlgN [Acetobacteraceae bacterium]|nr:MAG: flagellar biosynthesis protein FlgN [Acetobacteraceae bacterium]